jgi:hypothetical protein
MYEAIRDKLQPGTRVKITQQIAAHEYSWASDVSGTIVSFAQEPTGSWYAHGLDDKLWLDRLKLRMDDGEITTLSLDEYSRIEILKNGSAAGKASG